MSLELHGNIPLPKPTKPPLHWQPGQPVVQSDNQCNPAALVNALRCSPNNRQVDYDDAVNDWYKPVAGPHGSVLLKVLQQTVKKGGISSFVYDDHPSNAELKAALVNGPVIVAGNFYESMYNWQGGLLTISGKLVAQHTWVCVGVNYNKKFFSFISSWSTDNPIYKVPFAMQAQLFDTDGLMAVVKP